MAKIHFSNPKHFEFIISFIPTSGYLIIRPFSIKCIIIHLPIEPFCMVSSRPKLPKIQAMTESGVMVST